MIPNHLSVMWPTFVLALGNHLWQSTLFALLAGFLALLSRQNHARIRYGLWFAASLKFLIPFALLVFLGMLITSSGSSLDRGAGLLLPPLNVHAHHESHSISDPSPRPGKTRMYGNRWAANAGETKFAKLLIR
jgi:hypothetical protein